MFDLDDQLNYTFDLAEALDFFNQTEEIPCMTAEEQAKNFVSRYETAGSLFANQFNERMNQIRMNEKI